MDECHERAGGRATPRAKRRGASRSRSRMSSGLRAARAVPAEALGVVRVYSPRKWVSARHRDLHEVREIGAARAMASPCGCLTAGSRAPPRTRHLGGRWQGTRRVVGPFESTFLGDAIVAEAQAHRADVIHCTYPEYVPRCCVPTVANFWHPELSPWVRSRTRADRAESLRPALSDALNDRLALRRATVAVAMTETVYSALVRRNAHPVLIPAFVPDALVRDVLPDRPLVCVMIARWIDAPRKGLARAIVALDRARAGGLDVRLTLVGEFADPATKVDLPSFTTPIGRLDPARSTHARVRRCLLVPSLWEEFGYVVLEAMAAGVPVVAGPIDVTRTFQTDGIRIVDWDDRRTLRVASAKRLRLRTSAFRAGPGHRLPASRCWRRIAPPSIDAEPCQGQAPAPKGQRQSRPRRPRRCPRRLAPARRFLRPRTRSPWLPPAGHAESCSMMRLGGTARRRSRRLISPSRSPSSTYRSTHLHIRRVCGDAPELLDVALGLLVVSHGAPDDRQSAACRPGGGEGGHVTRSIPLCMLRNPGRGTSLVDGTPASAGPSSGSWLFRRELLTVRDQADLRLRCRRGITATERLTLVIGVEPDLRRASPHHPAQSLLAARAMRRSPRVPETRRRRVRAAGRSFGPPVPDHDAEDRDASRHLRPGAR